MRLRRGKQEEVPQMNWRLQQDIDKAGRVLVERLVSRNDLGAIVLGTFEHNPHWLLPAFRYAAARMLAHRAKWDRSIFAEARASGLQELMRAKRPLASLVRPEPLGIGGPDVEFDLRELRGWVRVATVTDFLAVTGDGWMERVVSTEMRLTWASIIIQEADSAVLHQYLASHHEPHVSRLRELLQGYIDQYGKIVLTPEDELEITLPGCAASLGEFALIFGRDGSAVSTPMQGAM